MYFWWGLFSVADLLNICEIESKWTTVCVQANEATCHLVDH